MATKKVPNVYVLLRTIADFVEEVPVIKDKCLKEKKEAALRALAILGEMFTPSVLAKKGGCSCGGGLPEEKP